MIFSCRPETFKRALYAWCSTSEVLTLPGTLFQVSLNTRLAARLLVRLEPRACSPWALRERPARGWAYCLPRRPLRLRGGGRKGRRGRPGAEGRPRAERWCGFPAGPLPTRRVSAPSRPPPWFPRPRTKQVVSSPTPCLRWLSTDPLPASALWACRQLTSGQAGTGPFESGLVSGWGPPRPGPQLYLLAGSSLVRAHRPQPLSSSSPPCWPWCPPLPWVPNPGQAGSSGVSPRSLADGDSSCATQPVKKKGYVQAAHQPATSTWSCTWRFGAWVPPPPTGSPVPPQVARLTKPTG